MAVVYRNEWNSKREELAVAEGLIKKIASLPGSNLEAVINGEKIKNIIGKACIINKNAIVLEYGHRGNGWGEILLGPESEITYDKAGKHKIIVYN